MLVKTNVVIDNNQPHTSPVSLADPRLTAGAPAPHANPGTRATFEIGYAVGVAEGIYQHEARHRVVVTACLDGEHHAGSLHYKGQAVDLRTKGLNGDEQRRILAGLKSVLEQQGFDVIIEADHIHIEFQPKPGETFLTRVA